ncbi:HNH endonuclease [Aeromonas salmonicida]|uniref:HNH endonuclease n=1 Tax=Aeromonas salmonicida TaxID=645 RepID=UPI00259DB796|nr:HNH endonuclease signature motif containing protein [Aeromonas salmonicida]MDM5149787.1 HNH endonuclease [Aeromonas salmonicida]
MKLVVDLSALHRAVAPLGKVVTDFSIKSQSGGWVDIGEHLKSGMILGKDVQLDDIDGGQGILHYNGHQVMLYIPNQSGFINQAIANGKQEGAKRVHVAECKTIIEMRDRGKFHDKYDVISRIDGLFPVFGSDYHSQQDVKGEAELAVCKNCLALLNHKNFSALSKEDKTKFVNDFSYARFFESYSSYFKCLPKSTVEFQSSGYTPDWPAISSKLRGELYYTCEQCGVNLTRDTKLLHVHHINGNKSDNSMGNLRALCADCHKKQPHHGHLYVSNKDMQRINECRREQNKFDVFNYENIVKCTDSALEGLVMKCQATAIPGPELGFVINDGGKMISIDLCWPRRKVAVLINMDNARNLKKLGWNVFSAFDALNNFFDFQAKVR